MEKAKKKKVILIGLGTAAAGILSYFGWEWFQGRKQKKEEKQDEQEEHGTGKDSIPGSSSDSTKHKYTLPSGGGSSSGFPLKKGSKGTKVKALQQALMSKYGASVLPKYGADGDFGNEVAAALKKEGLPSEIDESTYNVLVGGSGSGSDTNRYQPIADNLHNAVENNDFSSAMQALKLMKSTADYEGVNKIFENNTINFVRKTIVNGLLDEFTDDTQKQQISLEFTRMGLKYDGSKWSLSGLDNPRIITTRATIIHEKGGRKIEVPPHVVLGYKNGTEGEWTYFYPNNAEILMRVKSDTVTIHQSK